MGWSSYIPLIPFIFINNISEPYNKIAGTKDINLFTIIICGYGLAVGSV